MAGTSEKAKPRFLLESDGMSLVFEGTMKDKGTCEFTIPRLDKLLKENSAQASIEVIVEDRYFKPWKAEVELEAPIAVKVVETKEKPSQVRVSEPRVKQKRKLVVKENNPIKYKNRKGVIEEVFVMKVLEDTDTKVVFEAVDENDRRKRITLPK